MKLLHYKTDSGVKLGVMTERGVLNVEAAAARYAFSEKAVPIGLNDLLSDGVAGLRKLRDLSEKSVRDESGDASMFLTSGSITYSSCVPTPGKVICVGLNYRQHAKETGLPIPEYPILFNKYPNTLNGHGAIVPMPRLSSQVDYEAELAIVIGQRAKHVPAERALDAVFGYCTANDLSARDMQFRSSQWLPGKNCDGFCPLGPYLVTKDEVGDPNNLQIRCYVNGELRQNSNTADMIFSCEAVIAYVSGLFTLEPGDVILTGTPQGVAMGYPAGQEPYLREGDIVMAEIERLGSLTCTIGSRE